MLAQYTELTGRISLPPLWALGNQQSKWGYEDADEVRAIARGYRERDIPCDVVYLDIDHMDGYRVFTFDAERFPDPAGFVAELEADGFKVVVHHRPGREGRRGLRRLRVRPRARPVLQDQARHRVPQRRLAGAVRVPGLHEPGGARVVGRPAGAAVDAGVAGVWCDMDEPALFVPDQSTMPEDVVHPGGGDARYHKDVHNLYGSLMARAAREGWSGCGRTSGRS